MLFSSLTSVVLKMFLQPSFKFSSWLLLYSSCFVSSDRNLGTHSPVDEMAGSARGRVRAARTARATTQPRAVRPRTHNRASSAPHATLTPELLPRAACSTLRLQRPGRTRLDRELTEGLAGYQQISVRPSPGQAPAGRWRGRRRRQRRDHDARTHIGAGFR